jgi:hypothetical protein
MSFDWLNRIGIILNFLAGFLLAPDLIGIENINKIQKSIISVTNKIKRFIYVNFTGLINIYEIVDKNQIKSQLTSFGICVIFFLISWQKVSDGTGNIIDFFIFVVALLSGILFIFTFPFTLLTFIIQSLERNLNKDNALVPLLTFLGIIFFIVGNLFQFIATFAPSIVGVG